MKKNNNKNAGGKKPSREGKPGKARNKQSSVVADQVQRIVNPNVRGRALRHESQATKVAAKGQALRTPDSKGHKKLLDWAGLLSNPFVGVNSVKCPLNFNPAPSLLSQRITLVDAHSDVKVTAAYCRQLVIWPGHNILSAPAVAVGSAQLGGTGLAYLGDMDEVAFHARFQTISGSIFAVGPMNSPGGALTTRVAVSSHLSADSGIGIGGVITTSTAGVASGWDNPLPFTADPTVQGHSRWKLIAMGIRIRNKTPVQGRGGSIVTVQPANVINMAAYTAQSEFDRDPSFRIWGDGTDEVSISWIPRTRDLSYWHMTIATNTSIGTDNTSTALEGPAIVVWLNAATTADQYYSWELFGHYELSGNYVQVFSGQTHSMSTPPALVQQAMGAHIQNSPTAAGIQHTIAAAVGKQLTGAAADIGRFADEIVAKGAQAAVSAVRNSI